jgi:hypothetical protein
MDFKRDFESNTVGAARKRTIYLLRLAAGYVLLIIALTVGVTCEMASVFAWAVASDHNELAAFAGAAVLIGAGGIGWRLFRSTIDRVSRMTYVPPVRDQIAALAADSVLVRGSSAPIGDGGCLLRAGLHGTDQRSHELVRVPDPLAVTQDDCS